MRTPYGEEETLKRILDVTKDKKFWLDIKGRQLRIEQWSVPTYGDIVLNHKVEVDLPATVWFRGNEKSTIIAISENKIYVEPQPPRAVGAGQAINIHGSNLKIIGYLTDEDKRYLDAAAKIGIKNFMLSFVECWDDIKLVSDNYPVNDIIDKIESPKGVAWIDSFNNAAVTLMAARDDLYINTESKLTIFDHLKTIIDKDRDAILASRILESLIDNEHPSLSDLTDIGLMVMMGYKTFMFGDGLCLSKSFDRACNILSRSYFKWAKSM
ncbi:MAG: pyruvate kinase [Patescibacteria group bacterium]|jgi:pyruvate kinase